MVISIQKLAVGLRTNAYLYLFTKILLFFIAGLFRVVSQNDEMSARPIIIEKHNGPVITAKDNPTFLSEKSPSSDFGSALVSKEPADVSADSTSKDEKADDFYQLKHDVDYSAPYGEYWTNVYPPERQKRQHFQHRYEPQHRPESQHKHESQQQGYNGRSNFNRGYKPGRVHTSHRGRDGYRNQRSQAHRQINRRIKNNIQEKNYLKLNANRWHGNNRHVNRLKESGYPRKQLRQSYHEQQSHNTYKTKQSEKHLINPYSPKLDGFIQSFSLYTRETAAVHYDPNREGK